MKIKKSVIIECLNKIIGSYIRKEEPNLNIPGYGDVKFPPDIYFDRTNQLRIILVLLGEIEIWDQDEVDGEYIDDFLNQRGLKPPEAKTEPKLVELKEHKDEKRSQEVKDCKEVKDAKNEAQGKIEETNWQEFKRTLPWLVRGEFDSVDLAGLNSEQIKTLMIFFPYYVLAQDLREFAKQSNFSNQKNLIFRRLLLKFHLKDAEELLLKFPPEHPIWNCPLGDLENVSIRHHKSKRAILEEMSGLKNFKEFSAFLILYPCVDSSTIQHYPSVIKYSSSWTSSERKFFISTVLNDFSSLKQADPKIIAKINKGAEIIQLLKSKQFNPASITEDSLNDYYLNRQLYKAAYVLLLEGCSYEHTVAAVTMMLYFHINIDRFLSWDVIKVASILIKLNKDDVVWDGSPHIHSLAELNVFCHLVKNAHSSFMSAEVFLKETTPFHLECFNLLIDRIAFDYREVRKLPMKFCFLFNWLVSINIDVKIAATILFENQPGLNCDVFTYQATYYHFCNLNCAPAQILIRLKGLDNSSLRDLRENPALLEIKESKRSQLTVTSATTTELRKPQNIDVRSDNKDSKDTKISADQKQQGAKINAPSSAGAQLQSSSQIPGAKELKKELKGSEGREVKEVKNSTPAETSIKNLQQTKALVSVLYLRDLVKKYERERGFQKKLARKREDQYSKGMLLIANFLDIHSLKEILNPMEVIEFVEILTAAELLTSEKGSLTAKIISEIKKLLEQIFKKSFSEIKMVLNVFNSELIRNCNQKFGLKIFYVLTNDEAQLLLDHALCLKDSKKVQYFFMGAYALKRSEISSTHTYHLLFEYIQFCKNLENNIYDAVRELVSVLEEFSERKFLTAKNNGKILSLVMSNLIAIREHLNSFSKLFNEESFAMICSYPKLVNFQLKTYQLEHRQAYRIDLEFYFLMVQFFFDGDENLKELAERIYFIPRLFSSLISPELRCKIIEAGRQDPKLFGAFELCDSYVRIDSNISNDSLAQAQDKLKCRITPEFIRLYRTYVQTNPARLVFFAELFNFISDNSDVAKILSENASMISAILPRIIEWYEKERNKVLAPEIVIRLCREALMDIVLQAADKGGVSKLPMFSPNVLNIIGAMVFQADEVTPEVKPFLAINFNQTPREKLLYLLERKTEIKWANNELNNFLNKNDFLIPYFFAKLQEWRKAGNKIKNLTKNIFYQLCNKVLLSPLFSTPIGKNIQQHSIFDKELFNRIICPMSLGLANEASEFKPPLALDFPDLTPRDKLTYLLTERTKIQWNGLELENYLNQHDRLIPFFLEQVQKWRKEGHLIGELTKEVFYQLCPHEDYQLQHEFDVWMQQRP